MKNPFDLTLQASVLIAAELILLFTSAFWEATGLWAALLYMFLFTAGGYAISHSRGFLIAYILSNLAGVAFAWVGKGIFGDIGSTVAFTCAFFLLFRELVRHCFIKDDVDSIDRLLGGVAGYLLLGFFWHFQMGWATMFNPEAFLILRDDSVPTSPEKLYASFVTLTTLGYGDIVPMTGIARIIMMLTAISGTLYVAIFISALIGISNRKGL